jgi:hypothetical protein
MAPCFSLALGPRFGARKFQGPVDLRLGIPGALPCVELEPYSATRDFQGLAIALAIDVEGCCSLMFNLRHKASEVSFDTQLLIIPLDSTNLAETLAHSWHCLASCASLLAWLRLADGPCFSLASGPQFGARNFQGSVDLRLLGIPGALSCVGL